jgi:hypothetical protein
MLLSGLSNVVVEAVMGHGSADMIRRHYNQLDADDHRHIHHQRCDRRVHVLRRARRVWHSGVPGTPVGAGVSDHVWKVEEIVALRD